MQEEKEFRVHFRRGGVEGYRYVSALDAVAAVEIGQQYAREGDEIIMVEERI